MPTQVAAPPLPSLSQSKIIRDVWAENVVEEFARIRALVAEYPYVAMDTEFPGVVAKAVGAFKTTHEFYYQTMRCNVNLLKLIQVGLTLLNERGEAPDGVCTWQFNFRFSLTDDTYAQDSIELLTNAGIVFEHFSQHGIDVVQFAELLYSSGLILSDGVCWLSFHAGYDFGYVVRLLTDKPLPEREEEFLSIFHTLFPQVFDIKYLLRQTDITHSAGLDYLADLLTLRRFGTAHQSGSDSLMTGHAFFRLLKDRLGGAAPAAANGVLYGLCEDAASTATPATPNQPAVVSAQGGSAVGTQFPSAPLMSMVMHGSGRDVPHSGK